MYWAILFEVLEFASLLHLSILNLILRVGEWYTVVDFSEQKDEPRQQAFYEGVGRWLGRKQSLGIAVTTTIAAAAVSP